MATTLKSISSATFGTTKHVSFVPTPGPTLPASLSFTVPMLAGSLARTMALSTANPAIISTLTQGFHHLLNGLVDPVQTDLAFVQGIEDLGDSLRTAFSGFLGSAIADLYMLKLGHVFRCNGRELYRKKGKVFDFAYDSGPTVKGTDVVAVEAKGLIRHGATPTATKKATRSGYDAQIEPHLGTTLSGATVSRGYAIGFGRGLKTGAVSHLHVEETWWPSGGSPPRSSSPSGVPSSVVRRLVHNPLALGNFRSIFRLMGNQGILGAIDAALEGRREADALLVGQQQLVTVPWRNKEYFVSAPDGRLPGTQQAFHASFGVRCDAASEFFAGFPQIVRAGVSRPNLSRELRVEPLDIDREIAANDGGVEFPDGLAYFGHPMAPMIPGFHLHIFEIQTK